MVTVQASVKTLKEHVGHNITCVIKANKEAALICVDCSETLYAVNTEEYMLCKFCGEPSGSVDPDILCDECESLFGHARYSEL
jgi:uncharacterized CHY-type Zn-finger protein